MSIEEKLLSKSFYQTLIDGTKEGHPTEILGKMYMIEKQKEIPDFSSIRFAQGELYFLHKDFEAAIFKWENVSCIDLKPWAQKNIADAHVQLDLLELAEDIYKEVKTDSIVLKMEVLMQLFDLYKKLNKREQATEAIKNAVNLLPDYNFVTEDARQFFEESEDWSNAVELAVKEALRTKSLSWFGLLQKYVEEDRTAHLKPCYFNEVLKTLYEIDLFRFESLVASLWKYYKHRIEYILWLKEINALFLNNNLEGTYKWKTLPNLFKEAFDELTSGKYIINNISEIIPSLLTNWMKISSDDYSSSYCSAAIILWNSMFPSQLDANIVQKAENVLNEVRCQKNIIIQDGSNLLQLIEKWAVQEGFIEDHSFIEETNFMVEQEVEDNQSYIFFKIKKAIDFLKEKKKISERTFVEKINWNDELLAKLNGIQHQLKDMEEEKIDVIKTTFNEMKNQLQEKYLEQITTLLRSCADIVKENSDFGNLLIELEEEMNGRVVEFMENSAKDQFMIEAQKWMDICQKELNDSQCYLDEIKNSLHQLYGIEEEITFICDFKVLDDWKRDINRMVRGIAVVENLNILKSNMPTRLLLTSVGKLFGPISKHKDKLQNMYKKLIENTDYSPIVQTIVRPFFQQLEYFERSIERDIQMFFATPFDELRLASRKAQENLEKYKEDLIFMEENPEIYRDPLILFELKHRQYELMYNRDQLIHNKVQ